MNTIQSSRHRYLSVIVVGVLLSACGNKAADPTSQPSSKIVKDEPVRPVRTQIISNEAVGSILYLPGEVKARFEQRYGFRVNGKIAQRLVDVGQTVKVGQTLAIMDSSDVLPAIAAQGAQVEAARTDLALQQAELKRVIELSGKGFLSAAALDRQRAATDGSAARYKASQSQLASVQNNLAFQTLRSDKAGVVTAIDAEAGSVVAAGQSVVRVAQVGEKEIQVSVPERSVKALRDAPSIVALADAVPGKVYAAKLRELSPSADAGSRTFAAKLTVTNPDDNLRWGMSTTVRIDLEQVQGIVIPNTSLYTRDNQIRVWLVDKPTQTVRPVVVQLGASKDDGVIVLSGLKPGDIVVTAGANLLEPGQKVRLLESPVVVEVKKP